MKSFRSEEQHKTNTKLALEIIVSIGEEFKKSLIFEKGQDPVLAASLFCEENGLKPSAVYYIQRAIEKVIADAYEHEKDQLIEREHINEIDEFYHHEYEGKEEEEDNINDEEEDDEDDEEYNQNNYENTKKHVSTKISRSEKKCTPTKNKKKTSNTRRSHTEEKENIRMKSRQHGDKSPFSARNKSNQIDNVGARMYNQELARKLTKQKKLEEMQKQLEEVNLIEATFKPAINLNSQLISQRMDLQGQKEKMEIRKIARMDQIRIERECKQSAACTFQPQIGAVSQRIGQFAKHSREEHDVFSHLYLDSFKRQKDAELKEEAQSEAIAERIRIECPFQPEINFTPNLLKNMAEQQQIVPMDSEDNKNITSQSLIFSNGQVNALEFNRRNTALDQYQIYEEHKPNRKDMTFEISSDQISSPLFQQGRQQEMKLSSKQKISFTQNDENSQQQQSVGQMALSFKDVRDPMCSSEKKQMNQSGRDLAVPLRHSFQQYQSISSIKSKNSNIIAPLMTNEDDFMDYTKEKGLISASPRIDSPPCIIPNFIEIKHKSTPIKLQIESPFTQEYSEAKNDPIKQQKVQQLDKHIIPEVETPQTNIAAQSSANIKVPSNSALSSSTVKTEGTYDDNKQQNLTNTSKGLVSVWDELYVDAIHQMEKQKLAEIRAREYPEQLSKIKKISAQSDAIAKEQRNRLVECMFEALDGKKLGYLSSTNLYIERLSEEIVRIHKPLFNAITESQRNFNELTFKKAAKQFYSTINNQDLLTLSTLLSAKISDTKYSQNETASRHKKIGKTGVHSLQAEGYPLVQSCRTCCDTVEIMETLEKMKTDNPITSK